MKYLITSISIYVLCVSSFAQGKWNWPEDQALRKETETNEAHYKVLMAQNKYQEAMAPLNRLYVDAPNLNPSIYINGVKCLNNIIKDVSDKERKVRLQDSVLWMYDQRLAHFENDASTMDRKAYEAFKMYYKTPSKYRFLSGLYEQAYAMNGPDVSYFNLNPYMMLTTNYYKTNPSEMPAEKVLDIHTQISDVIEQQRKAGKNMERLDKEQDKVDGFLASIGDKVLSCSFIENNLVQDFRKDPSNIGVAKKIFRYSIMAKCSDRDYFLEASETVYADQPSYQLANAIGSKYLGSGEYAKAMEFHQEAVKLAGDNEQKAASFLGQAIAASKLGQKTRARNLAYESLSAKPGNADAYNLIGNMYFTSFQTCQGGESKVLDRGVFLAAYKMYEKAGNEAQMQASKEQFPSIEEIFNESYEEGETITVGCWINETVAIQRR